MFMDLKTLSWSKECLDFFGVNEKCLPKIVSNCEVYGKMGTGVLKGVPIAGMIGDQQAALVGQMCLVPGTAKNTYGELCSFILLCKTLSLGPGTGCFMLYNTGKDVVPSTHGLLTTVCTIYTTL